MQSIHLDAYAIQIGELSTTFPSWLNQQHYEKLAVLVDQNTHEYCLPKLIQLLQNHTFSTSVILPGEIYKTFDTCQSILNDWFDQGLDRKSLVINLGGGVIGDMGGFCASIFMRGIDFVQIPTTLLSQVDASVGGKVGIDFKGLKNALGRFQNPKAVFIDPFFLQTLPARQLKSGFAEMIKHALISSPEEWKKIRTLTDLESVNWERWIYNSVSIKKRVVEKDYEEKGLRKILNFGHTIGHAIESWSLRTKNPLLHGEAIAIGMIAEAYLSHKLLKLSKEELKQINHFILTFFGKYQLPEKRFDELFSFLRKDKKNEQGQLLFSLLNKIGEPVFNQPCTTDDILESLNYYRNLVFL